MAWPTKRAVLRFWRPFRVAAGLLLLGVAVWVIAGKSSELSGAGVFLTQLRWAWLALAGLAELCSYLALAALQRSLLRAGETRARLGRVSLVTFAGSAIQSALPVGAAFAGLYYFRQFEWLGADDVLAGWVVIASATVAFVTLALFAGVGLSLAATTGSTFDLVEAIVGVIVVGLLVALLWSRRAQVFVLVQKAVARVETRMKRPGQFTGPLARGVERMRSVAPTPVEWARALAWGASSWVADCACLMFAFIAVGAAVPWQGLLLAYCGGQLAVSLPITPGGLGVVEGSLTVALVAFGGGQAATVAAVLLYRVMSFWIPLPVGGACYLALMQMRRRVQHRRLAPALTGPGNGPTAAPGVPTPSVAPLSDATSGDASGGDASSSDAHDAAGTDAAPDRPRRARLGHAPAAASGAWPASTSSVPATAADGYAADAKSGGGAGGQGARSTEDDEGTGPATGTKSEAGKEVREL